MADDRSGACAVDIAVPEIEKFPSGLIGPVGKPDTMAVELGAVRKTAKAVEDHDPIHYDAPAALARGYRGVVVSWPLLWPMIVGDEIRLEVAITETRLKQGRSGPLGVVVAERRFTGQLGQLCGVLRTTIIRR